MSTLARARELFAEALSTVEGVTVRPRGTVKAPKAGAGWVTVGRGEPADYVRTSVVLVAVICLGPDPTAAEDRLDTWMVDLLDTATCIDDLPTADVAVEPILLPVDGGEPLNALTVSVTTEVDAQ